MNTNSNYSPASTFSEWLVPPYLPTLLPNICIIFCFFMKNIIYVKSVIACVWIFYEGLMRLCSYVILSCTSILDQGNDDDGL